jgi:serine/threonine protein kinase
MHQHVGKYEILKLLGKGATGTVYLAADPFTQREVAIKLLDQLPSDPEEAKRALKFFQNEASLAGKLRHPHIISIYDAGIEKKDGKDLRYLVMELVDGTSLQPHCEPKKLLPVSRAVQIAYKCCKALDYANTVGVVHRDIKPANIMVRPDFDIKVADFGAAQLSRSDTTQVAGVGSPAYMSPEQIRMETLTQQTDIYSLGVTMFRLLTGRVPFKASTQAGLVYAILNTVPSRPVKLRPDLPLLLDAIVMKAMSRDPAERYHSWLEFGKDLSQAFVSLRLVGDSVSDSERFNRLRGFPFFEDFNDVALWEVVRIGAWKAVPAGTTLILEGEEGDDFYFLADGDVDVSLAGKNIASVQPGGCFGEILYFSDRVSRRTTTVTARTDITAIEIKAQALRAATDACQAAFNKACMRVLIERLVYSNQRLAQAA